MLVKHIKIKTLGGFSIWVNNVPLIEDAPKITKPWQLFCYLLINRERYVPNQKLISVVWGNDELSDPANVLKNAVYSLRKELCDGESSIESPIIYSTGGYRFDPAVAVDIDIDLFDEKYNSIFSNKTQKNNTSALQEAAALYTGTFLPQLEQEYWVIPLALDYKRKFVEICNALAASYWAEKEYQQVMEVCSAARQTDPFDEQSNIFYFRAMDNLRMYRAIVTAYSSFIQLYSSPGSMGPSKEIEDIFISASARINKAEQDILLIKAELSELEDAPRPNKGALCCSYNSLKHFIPFARRTAERNSQALLVALFSLSENPAYKKLDQPFDLTRSMTEFRVCTMGLLRKSDAISMYSENQYVVLLTVSSLDDGRIVRDRIIKHFEQLATGKKTSVDVKITPV